MQALLKIFLSVVLVLAVTWSLGLEVSRAGEVLSFDCRLLFVPSRSVQRLQDEPWGEEKRIVVEYGRALAGVREKMEPKRYRRFVQTMVDIRNFYDFPISSFAESDDARVMSRIRKARILGRTEAYYLDVEFLDWRIRELLEEELER